MKISLLSIKQFIDFFNKDLSPQELANTLTMAGIEVEGIEYLKAKLKGIVIGKILSIERHPNAERLKICSVEIGQKTPQVIVCGATNARAGLTVAVATPGTKLPNGVNISISEIRGVKSNGMICSYQEMCLNAPNNYEDGIAELDSSLIEGRDLSEQAFKNDVIFDFSLTPNRGDCASALGIARELVAFGIGTIKPFTSQKPTNLLLQKKLLPEGFVGCVLKINNVTNLPNLDDLVITYGMPIVFFDADKLNGDLIIETVIRDEVEKYNKLGKFMMPYKSIVACFSNGEEKYCASVLGIVNDEDFAPTSSTKNIMMICFSVEQKRFLEYAKGIKSQGNSAEARYRLERGTDRGLIEGVAYEIANQLGGQISSEGFVYNGIQDKQLILEYNPKITKHIIGVDVSLDEAKGYLKNLGFVCIPSQNYNDRILVIAPTYRNDITIEEDLTEEIVRQINIDQITQEQLSFRPSSQSADDLVYSNTQATKKVLATMGYKEVINYLFIEKTLEESFGSKKPENELSLQESISDLEIIQSCALPNLLKNIKHNLNTTNFKRLALFESTNIFTSCSEFENVVAGVMVMPNKFKPSCNGIFEVKNAVLSVFDLFRFGIEGRDFTTEKSNSKYANPYNNFKFVMHNQTIATFGEINLHLLQNLKIEERVFFFEIYLSRVNEIFACTKSVNADLIPDELKGANPLVLKLISNGMGISLNELKAKVAGLKASDPMAITSLKTQVATIDEIISKHGINFANQITNSMLTNTNKEDDLSEENTPHIAGLISKGIVKSFLPELRDICFVINKTIPLGKIIETILATAPNVTRAWIIDIYKKNEEFGTENHSATFGLLFSSDANTDEVNIATKAIVENVVKTHNAKFRGT